MRDVGLLETLWHKASLFILPATKAVFSDSSAGRAAGREHEFATRIAVAPEQT